MGGVLATTCNTENFRQPPPKNKTKKKKSPHIEHTV
jgi:hypothetical protein